MGRAGVGVGETAEKRTFSKVSMQGRGKNVVVVNMSLVQRYGLKRWFASTELQVTEAQGACAAVCFLCVLKRAREM